MEIIEKLLKKTKRTIDKTINVLVVDDSKVDRVLLIESLNRYEQLKEYNFNITQANSVSKAYELLENEVYDLMFLDFMMDDSDGFTLLSSLTAEQKAKTPIIFVTAYGNDLIKEDCISIGAKDYISKNDLNSIQFEKTLEKALN